MSEGGEKKITTLYTLPNELIIHILYQLDYESLLNSAQTCATFYDLVSTTTSLQCIVQMATIGVEATSCTLKSNELMEKLNERRKRWDALDWSSVIALEVNGSCKAYELVGGVFGQSDGINISFNWLPTNSSPGRHIKRQMDIPVRDFAMDPSQDLLVVLEQNDIYYWSTVDNIVVIHLRTLTTDLPHQAAQSHRLEFPIPPEEPHGNGTGGAALYLMRDLLSIKIQIGTWANNRCRVVVFNWKKGIMIYDSDEVSLGHGLKDFELLTDNIFMMTSTDDSGSLVLYSFNHQSAEPSPPKACCVLKLPPMSAGNTLKSCDIYHDPCVAFPKHSDDRPFKTLLDDALIILDLSYHVKHDDCTFCIITPNIREYNMIVPTRILLRYAKKHGHGDHLEWGSVPSYEWEEWGPHKTRLFNSCIPKGWLRFSCGQQIALSHSEEIPNPPIQILDFARHLKPKISSDETAVVQCVGRDSPACIGDPSPFEKEIRTYLPYHRVIRLSLAACRIFMLDEDRILGVTIDSVSGEDKTGMNIYTF